MGSLPPNESSHVMAVVEPTPQKEREREWAPWAMGRLFFWGGGGGGARWEEEGQEETD